MPLETTSSNATEQAPVWWRITTAAAPLYVLMLVDLVAMTIVLAGLGTQATASLAAFTFASSVQAPASAAVAGALRGVMPFIAPYKGDREKVIPVLRDGRWLALGFGLAGGVVLMVLPLLALAIGVPSDVRRELGLLPLMMALGLIFQAIKQSAGSALIALDRSGDVMWPGMVETVLAIVLSPVMIHGVGAIPGYGVDGAGAALLIASGFGTVVADWRLRRLQGPIGWGMPRPRNLWALARVSIPLAGTALTKFGTLSVLAVAAARIGTLETAAHGVLAYLVNLVKYAATAVGQATVPTMSRFARDHDTRSVRKTVWDAFIVITIPSAAALAGFLFLGSPVAGLFTDDPAVQALTAGMMPLLALSALVEAFVAVPGFALTALKKTSVTLKSYLVIYGMLSLAAIPTATAFGLTGLWVALSLANVSLLGTQMLAFYRNSAKSAPVLS